MSTMVDLIFDYIKKNSIVEHSEEYIHTYLDGSTQLFTIETADKDVLLWDADDKTRYSANVPTKQFMVIVKTEIFCRLDWFDGKRFRSVRSAINAIQKQETK